MGVNRGVKYFLAAVTLVCAVAAAGQGRQGRRVIAGLENHTEYRSLVAEEALRAREADSLTHEIGELRRAFLADSVGRGTSSTAILQLEEQGFEVRGQMARLASRINAIEQEWILAGLHSDGAGEDHDDMPSADGTSSHGHSWREFFASNLSAELAGELTRAAEAEVSMPTHVATLLDNHALISSLAADYDQTKTHAEADVIHSRLDSLTAASHALDEKAAARWEGVFDSKSYIYSLVAERHGWSDIQREWRRSLTQMEGPLATAREASSSVALADYSVQKPLLLAHEGRIAQKIGDHRAADSLKTALQTLAPLDLPTQITLQEPLFLDYVDVATGVWPYNQHNPIPAVVVPRRGVMWRMLVGTFGTQQRPAMFHGVAPIAFSRGDDGRWIYFVGGFPSHDKAQAAVEILRRAGFRNPQPVVWVDGLYHDPAAAAKLTKNEQP